MITVTSTADPDDSSSYTCARDLPGPPAPAPDGLCTLRRAIIEATHLIYNTPSARPVLIRFNIPTGDPGYSAADGAWVIQLFNTSQANALPTLGSTDVNLSGAVVVSGTTQPNYGGNRPNAPRIIVRGPTGGAKNGLVVNGNGNVIHGLAFQQLKDMLILNHSDNVASGNWFGLGVHLRNPAQPQEGGGSGAVKTSAGSGHNLIAGNVILGMSGDGINVAGAVGGNDTIIRENFIGTRVNGTIDVAAVSPANRCKPDAASNNWFGGAGIKLSGLRHQVLSNTLVGLLIQGGALQTPPHAINVLSGQDHLIQGNRIGRDALGADVWTCGRGIDSSAGFVRVYSNTLVNTGWQAVFINGGYTSINANAARWNVILTSTAPIDFGDSVPEPLKLFAPARVTGLKGVQVTGTHTSYCPFCLVDVYLDDADNVAEALAWLGAATADVNGAWTFTLPAALAAGQGIRLVTTSRDYGVIPNFEAGTSTRMSALFTGAFKAYVPVARR